MLSSLNNSCLHDDSFFPVLHLAHLLFPVDEAIPCALIRLQYLKIIQELWRGLHNNPNK